MNTQALGIASSLGLDTFAYELGRLLANRFESERFYGGELGKNTLILCVDIGDGFFGQEVKNVADQLTLLIREHGRDKFVELPLPDIGESHRSTDKQTNISMRITRQLHAADSLPVYRVEVGMN